MSEVNKKGLSLNFSGCFLQEAERLALAKRLTMTCRTDREDKEAKEREERLEAEFDGLLDEDEFLQDYIQNRMKEMMMQQVNVIRLSVTSLWGRA